jgi:hypothetical protein
MGALLRVGLALAMVTFWAAGSSQAQDGLTKQDRQGSVSVSVTLTAPPAVGSPLKAKVVLDTHSVGLDGIKFEQAVALRMSDGTDIPPTAVEQATGSGHHREAVLVFPPLARPGDVHIVVKNVGGVAERSFSWELPPTR